MLKSPCIVFAFLCLFVSCFAVQLLDIEDFRDFSEYSRKSCRQIAKKEFSDAPNWQFACDKFGVIVLDVMDNQARAICNNVANVGELTAVKRIKEFPFNWAIEQIIADTSRFLLSRQSVKDADVKLEFTKKLLEPWMNLCSNTKTSLNIKATQGGTLDGDNVDRLSRNQNERISREYPERIKKKVKVLDEDDDDEL
ncbi:hypothetical protein RCL1_002848 [Eukaryota sp. TZLM3-RCL]